MRYGMWNSVLISGETGSENGIIIADEEYKNACRITLEKCERYYAITCGVYGAMVHTVFTDSEHYKDMYDDMKSELQEFLDRDTSALEEEEFYEQFTEKYI
jgi:hypothetical protein